MKCFFEQPEKCRLPKLWLGLCFFLVIAVQGNAQDLSGIKAKSYILVDAKTGEVVFQRNAHQAHPPASTVKLMTALLVWERTGLDGSIQVTRQDTMVEPSHIPLRAGETVSIREMTHALLIGSDNDSAMVLARAAGGSMGSFVELMNKRARALGCTKTVFKNPHGLPVSGQVTTASDMLKIFQKVLSVRELRSICTMKTYRLKTQIGPQNIKNHNKLLGVYTGMGPAKTGWTIASRHTYAASAFRNGRELHLIILNSPNKWVDARALFDAGFAKPSRQTEAPDVILAEAPTSNPEAEPAAPVVTVKKEAFQGGHGPVIETLPSIPARLSPVSHSSTKADSQASPVTTHTVRRGETLFSIGKSYGVNVPQILRYNSLSDPNQIHPGQVLFIPASSPAS